MKLFLMKIWLLKILCNRQSLTVWWSFSLKRYLKQLKRLNDIFKKTWHLILKIATEKSLKFQIIHKSLHLIEELIFSSNC